MVLSGVDLLSDSADSGFVQSHNDKQILAIKPQFCIFVDYLNVC